MSLKDLPLEVLEHIARHLDSPCLKTFALISKPCHGAAIPSTFHSICFELGPQLTLPQNVGSLVKALKRADAFRHVRTFEIRGMLEELKTGQEFDQFTKPGEDGYHPWWTGNQPFREEHDLGAVHHRRADLRPPSSVYQNDLVWSPLADLLGRLPALVDLVWECRAQFPPCLLKKLKDLPGCRLHNRFFYLRSLRDLEIDHHEYALITLPQLSTVTTNYSVVDQDGNDDFNYMAMLDVVVGLAPNLKEVSLHYRAGRFSMRNRPPTRTTEWGPLPRQVPPTRGNLETLDISGTIDGHRETTSECLERWSAVTDLSKLRQLYLELMDQSALEWIATRKPFASLSTLSFAIDSTSSRGPATSDLAYFLENLPPLQEIAIRDGLMDSALQHLMHRHGPTLRYFRYGPNTSPEHDSIIWDAQKILELQAACPHIEDLFLGIRRSMGDDREMDIYHALGSFPRLKKLHLGLQCWNRSLLTQVPDEYINSPDYVLHHACAEEWFNDFDQLPFPPTADNLLQNTPLNGHIKMAFLNGAVDSTLALAIWTAISSAKPENSQSLQRLRVIPHGAALFGDGYPIELACLRNVMRHFECSWQVRKALRDDAPLPEVVPWRYSAEFLMRKPKPQLDPDVAAVMQKIWPEILDEGRDWRVDWGSLGVGDAGTG